MDDLEKYKKWLYRLVTAFLVILVAVGFFSGSSHEELELIAEIPLGQSVDQVVSGDLESSELESEVAVATAQPLVKPRPTSAPKQAAPMAAPTPVRQEPVEKQIEIEEPPVRQVEENEEPQASSLSPQEPEPEEEPKEEPAPLVSGDGCIAGQIDLNTASLDELDQIKNVGPVIAQRIIDARPFSSLQELESKVKGIGPKYMADIKSEGKACVD